MSAAIVVRSNITRYFLFYT